VKVAIVQMASQIIPNVVVNTWYRSATVINTLARMIKTETTIGNATGMQRKAQQRLLGGGGGWDSIVQMAPPLIGQSVPSKSPLSLSLRNLTEFCDLSSLIRIMRGDPLIEFANSHCFLHQNH